ncbi:UNVERIFIED_CONTAM: hypothetical protein Sradi_1525400 [Sesamum radiatum]|uniref:Uncharacterized protein n=1 Tax=Sesamum radiatum TaxID=300843 RepID=A0AAW2UA07_SESRA
MRDCSRRIEVVESTKEGGLRYGAWLREPRGVSLGQWLGVKVRFWVTVGWGWGSGGIAKLFWPLWGVIFSVLEGMR